MKQILTVSLCLMLSLAYVLASSVEVSAGAAISESTEACLVCHAALNPGIVEDWHRSRHAKTTPEMALDKPKLERRVSSDSIPEELQSVAVGCYECHGLNASAHTDNFEHLGFQINVVVSPKDCSTCHSVEVEEYAGSKKAEALLILQKNPVYHTLVETITSVKDRKDGKIVPRDASYHAKGESCYACHGTDVTVEGTRTVSTDFGEVDVPELANWPNQGVGRANPDGSLGSCTACHPRHSFSIEVARKPYTCSQCHLEPDVPAYNVYKESKHGNIFDSKRSEWAWDDVPWEVGRDFGAPTCATCHNSLIASPEGDLIASRTHDFGARLWIRIFGLIYSHPQPKSGKTYEIANKDGLPLPTTFTGERASEYLIEDTEQEQRRNEMSKICRSCHSTSWVNGHLAKIETTSEEADEMVLTATQLLLEAWDKGLEDQSNPFDEAIEQKWIEQWLINANSVRYATAMSGPDYAAFKHGWWALTRNLQEMHDLIELKSGSTK